MANMGNAKLARFAVVGCATLLVTGLAWAADWPQWRGPNRDNKVTDFKVPATWPNTLTKKWSITISDKGAGGESSPLLVGDKVYVFTRKGNSEVTLCLDAANGKEIWNDKYASNPSFSGDKQHSGPRGTPAVAEGKIVTFGVDGDLSCLDAATGKVAWRKKTGKAPQFHTACSPLIVNGICIVYGSTGLTAFDLASGAQKWQAKSVTADQASPVVMDVGGTKQVVAQVGSKSLVGVDLTDGKVLWTAAFNGNSMQTPIVDGQTVIGSAPSGTAAFKIEKQGNSFTATQLWKQNAKASKYNTPVLNSGVVKDGLIFGLSGGNSTTLFCEDAKSGNVLWQNKGKGGECGHILNVGPVLIYCGSDGKLVVFEADAKAYKEVKSYTVSTNTGINGPWSCPILTGNRIFVKDNAGTLTLWTIE